MALLYAAFMSLSLRLRLNRRAAQSSPSTRTNSANWTRRAALLGGALLLSPQMATAGSPAKTDPYELLDQMGETLKLVEEEYFEVPDQAELLSGAVQGMVSGLDPHSAYFNREDRKVFEGSTSGKFGGIGVEVEFSDDEIVVIAPIENSPADRAGIRSGDRIVALDGKPLVDEKPHDIVRLMRGRIGTQLSLTLKSAGDGTLREVRVTREQITVTSVRAQLMLGGIAYFRIKAFQAGTHSELLEALGKAKEQAGSLSGVILDLRNNPGGLVREATAVADEFLCGGVIYSTRHRGRVLRIAEAHSGGAWSRGPVVVLINEYSASAAELVAGALKDRGRAKLLGARTFGKGSVQTVLNLGHGGALKLTTALYFTPSGQTTQAQGVTPHLRVDPGYKEGTRLRVLKESDLKGHLLEGKADEKKAGPSDAGGAPPTNEDLHLGVARVITENPEDGQDLALREAYRLLTRGHVAETTENKE